MATQINALTPIKVIDLGVAEERLQIISGSKSLSWECQKKGCYWSIQIIYLDPIIDLDSGESVAESEFFLGK